MQEAYYTSTEGFVNGWKACTRQGEILKCDAHKLWLHENWWWRGSRWDLWIAATVKNLVQLWCFQCPDLLRREGRVRPQSTAELPHSVPGSGQNRVGQVGLTLAHQLFAPSLHIISTCSHPQHVKGPPGCSGTTCAGARDVLCPLWPYDLSSSSVEDSDFTSVSRWQQPASAVFTVFTLDTEDLDNCGHWATA